MFHVDCLWNRKCVYDKHADQYHVLFPYMAGVSSLSGYLGTVSQSADTLFRL